MGRASEGAYLGEHADGVSHGSTGHVGRDAVALAQRLLVPAVERKEVHALSLLRAAATVLL